MPSFSGRTAANVPITGYVSRAKVIAFLDECVRDQWRRVAVGDGCTILAAYNGIGVYVHPQLRGDN